MAIHIAVFWTYFTIFQGFAMTIRLFVFSACTSLVTLSSPAVFSLGLIDTSFAVNLNSPGDVGRFAGKLPVLEGASGPVTYNLIFDGGGLFEVIDSGQGIDFMNLDSYDPVTNTSTPDSNLSITRAPHKFENVRTHRGRFAGTTHPESMQVPVQMIGSATLTPDAPNIMRFGVTNNSDSSNALLDFSIESTSLISSALISDVSTNGGYSDYQYDLNFWSGLGPTVDFNFTHTANDWWQEWLWWSHIEVVNSGIFVANPDAIVPGTYSVVIEASDGLGLTDQKSYIIEVEGILDGDTDGDYDVDNADLGRAAGNFTGSGGSIFMTRADGDMDGDGDVDNADIGLIAGAFTGARADSATIYASTLTSSVSVPEPSSLALLGLGGLLLTRRRR